MKKGQKYLPLRLADFSQERDKWYLESFYDRSLTSRPVTLEEYITFLFGDDFGKPEYRGIFEGLNNLTTNRQFLTKLFREIPIEAFRSMDGLAVKTELMDLFGIASLIQLWSRYKLVYKVQKDFFEELKETKTVEIPESTLQYLPASVFYIDLSECESVDPIQGAFVYTQKNTSGYQVVIYMETADATTFSYYSNFIYNDERIAVLKADSLPNTNFMAVNISEDGTYSGEGKKYGTDSRYDVVRVVLQVLMFLSAGNTDIQENPVTKKTYRASDVVKNRFSEIHMWDVGVRYGQAIKLAKKNAEKEYEEASAEQDNTSKRSHRSPRPHIRSAHWQRYHVGEGRKEIRINWVLSTIVCGGKDIPVVIHDIEKEQTNG